MSCAKVSAGTTLLTSPMATPSAGVTSAPEKISQDSAFCGTFFITAAMASVGGMPCFTSEKASLAASDTRVMSQPPASAAPKPMAGAWTSETTGTGQAWIAA